MKTTMIAPLSHIKSETNAYNAKPIVRLKFFIHFVLQYVAVTRVGFHQCYDCWKFVPELGVNAEQDRRMEYYISIAILL